MEALLKLRESKSGRQHPDSLMAAANLGVNYKEADRLNEALPLLEEAYRESRKHVKLRFVREHLVKGYLQSGKREAAAQIQKEILADARKLPKESPKLIGQLCSVGLSLIQTRNFVDAETLLRECLAICENGQLDVWQTFNVRSLLGGALFGQKKYADAEPLLLLGYQGLKQREQAIPPRSRKAIPEALERLIELSTAMNRPDEVKKWQAEKESSKSKAKPVESSKP
jgi:hypothetical protein